jgi:hypothetical protein
VDLAGVVCVRGERFCVLAHLSSRGGHKTFLNHRGSLRSGARVLK